LKRRVITILLVLVAGFLLNLLVLFALAAFGSALDHTENSGRQVGEGSWNLTVTPSITGDIVGWFERGSNTGMFGPPPQDILPPWVTDPAPSPDSISGVLERARVFLAVGFPFRTAWCDAHTHTVNKDRSRVNHDTRGGVRLPFGNLHTSVVGPMPATLPLRPIWTGVLLNTLVYAAVLVIFMWAGRGVRAHSRFRRGRCPRCAYSLNGNYSRGCSECGWRLINEAG